ncbi:uncharacterized protein LOC129236387 [Anastrepha obliqua]|uniref:uncharacterized protein LOC129236387 n=1 Tax=Anastrepha obliqua TaxID=95512 RepID=UPI002409F2CC|nr:uncharacterized protein LOC129236387 [Anastrepha obliqua]
MRSMRTESKDENLDVEQPSTSRYSPKCPVEVAAVSPKGSAYRNLAQRVLQAPLQCRLAHKLRLAVFEGNSPNPRHNKKLKLAIRRVTEQGLSMDMVQQIINRFAETREMLHRQILQIRYNRKIFLICILRSGDSMELKGSLMPLMRTHNASFVHVMHNFYSSAVIEAIISFQTSLDFSDLEGSIARDATACKAQAIEIVDYETGAVNFKCEPSEMDAVLKAVISKGYKVLNTEYSFQAKQLIMLDEREQKEYRRFRAKLMKAHDFDMIFDNVANDEIGDEEGEGEAINKTA